MHDLLRFWPDVRPRVWRYVVSILLALVSTGVGFFVPVLTGAAVDGPIAQKDLRGLALLVAAVAAVGLVEAASQLIRRTITAAMTAEWEVLWRRRLFSHLQRLDVAHHDAWDSGQMLSRATNDLSMLRRFAAFGLPFIVITPFLIAIGAIMLAFIHPVFVVILLVVALPTMVGVAWFSSRYKIASRAAQDVMGEVSTSVEESVQGIRVLLAFGRSPWATARFRAIVDRLRDHEITKVRLEAWLFGAVMVLPQLAMVGFAIVGAWGVVGGWITLGQTVAALTLMMYLRMPIEMFGFLLGDALMSATAAARYWELMDQEPRITDPDHDGRPAVGAAADAADAAPRPAPQPGVLEFDDVVFQHDDADEPLLRGVSLRIEPAETVALVGTTGSGKTALAALVPRLFDVTGGAVRIDGVDVRELALSDLRSRVGVAFEEPILFSASIRENVAMGTQAIEGADTIDEERIREALTIAQAADFVAELPDDLDTEVGEQGLSLSGGQRQRIALARAVAGHPPFLVLDDPLSAVDVETEDRVQQQLRTVLDTTTALIVAHRPSTAALADRVAVMDAGRIIAVGGHEELLATSAVYRDLMGVSA
ncbi:MAG TPA: ABC transporter ATP-binding protein/permease [Brevibacterium senegalense]|uniref:ABC transporter ATP-binding protein/permease n=1 Tax=Brevibacterium senegalense TaxID=1033736 RepID=A0A921MBE4_9MICO|nr:ABC transporter ATP-binding protein/permease [Brevibacterium senegalense]